MVLQSNFRKFHDEIKFDKEENKNWLTAKRDMLVQELQTWLSNNNLPSVKAYNQGSYAMGTGVKPTGDGDFDIDIALVFDLNVKDYQPVVVKEWVRDAMSQYANRDVEMMRPCVRVQYHRNNNEHYHVDLAIYGKKDSQQEKTNLQIAKGFSGSDEQHKLWEDSEPFKLKDTINNKFTNQENRAQFKRIICYLKRWKDINFKTSGDGAPTGIALTAIAYEWYTPHFKSGNNIDDLYALKCMLWHCDKGNYGLNIRLPVEPHNNLFEKMLETNRHVIAYRDKMKELYSAIQTAFSTSDKVKAIELLQGQFGEDFPS